MPCEEAVRLPVHRGTGGGVLVCPQDGLLCGLTLDKLADRLSGKEKKNRL